MYEIVVQEANKKSSKIGKNFFIIKWFKNIAQRLGIAAGRGFIAGQAPELKPIEKLKYKITTKSSTEFRPPEPLLIVNYSRLLQRQALLAAILLLADVFLSSQYGSINR